MAIPGLNGALGANGLHTLPGAIAAMGLHTLPGAIAGLGLHVGAAPAHIMPPAGGASPLSRIQQILHSEHGHANLGAALGENGLHTLPGELAQYFTHPTQTSAVSDPTMAGAGAAPPNPIESILAAFKAYRPPTQPQGLVHAASGMAKAY